MARMAHKLIPFSLSTLALMFVAVGCGPTAEQKKIEELTAEKDKLQKDLEDRDRLLNDKSVKETEAQGTINQLEGELAKLRAQGAKGKAGADGWITMNNFDMISVPGSVLFEAGKADLTSSGRAKLSQIASDIRSRYRDRDIYVFGHTDDQPIKKSKWKDNWELGAHRSLMVVRALHDHGVDNRNLVQASCSQYRPKLGSGGEKARAQNRRVEFYAVPKKGGNIIEDRTTAKAKTTTDD